MFFSENLAIYENVKKYGTAAQATDDTILQRMRFACWMTKATNIHSEYVILIAFPWQKRLCEQASMICYKCMACLFGCCEPTDESDICRKDG
jgi:hypothetical protein